MCAQDRDLDRCRSRLPGRWLRACPPSWPARSCLRLRLARAAGPRLRSDCAHPLEDLDKPEVDLPPLHVDLDDLHADLVAEPVDAAGVLAAQDVRALDEPVVVVGHRRDVDQALDEVLDQLDEQAERAPRR